MSLPLPRLDDRTWQDLRDEGVSLIPRYAPTWTDHNVTDPGVTLIELLAYQAEQTMYRLDQIGEPHQRAFLRLIGAHHLPSGPRPAATLLQFDPLHGHLPTLADARIVAGSYFVPRQSPKSSGSVHRERKVLGVGESIDPPRLRSAGEPDEPMLRSDGPDEAPTVLEVGFRAAHDLDLTGIRLAVVQSYDGRDYRDITDILVCAQTAAAWGTNPVDADEAASDRHPALYLGLNLDLVDPARKTAQEPRTPDWALTIWYIPNESKPGGFSSSEADSFEPSERASAPPHAHESVPPRSKAVTLYDANAEPPDHHGLEVRWEYWCSGSWHGVPAAGFRDETRGLTRPGRVVIPGMIFAMGASKRVLGAVPAEHSYLRCRLSKGRPDEAPLVRGLFVDAVLVEQWDRAVTPFRAQPAQTLDATKVVPPETLRDLQMTDSTEADVNDAANDLAARGWGSVAAAWGAWPLWSEHGFDASARTNPELEADDEPLYSGRTRMRAVVIGVGTGEPNQAFALPCPPDRTYFKPESPDTEDDGPDLRIMTDKLKVWTLEPPWGWMLKSKHGEKWRTFAWTLFPDLHAGSRRVHCFRYEATPTSSGQSRYAPPGRIVFGDGENGRVPPPGALILASYSWTVAEAANFSAGFIWARASDRELDHPERVKLHPTIRFRNPLLVAGGRDAEPLSDALRRLASEFAAPEKLVQLAGKSSENSLDGADIADVEVPSMAVNLVDFECLARCTPGTTVARARGWSEVDPRFPGHAAPGAVTLVIVPKLPSDRPMPTKGLLRRVTAFLCERRPIACRVFVIGPEYTLVRIRATLHTAAGDVKNVLEAARAAVRLFLHPIYGGTTGKGWPFGRHVHTGEMMRILAEVQDVRHVTGLRLAGADGEWTESAVLVGPRSLVELQEPVLDVKGDA